VRWGQTQPASNHTTPQHPLETSYDSAPDEPQLSSCQVPWEEEEEEGCMTLIR